MEKMAELIPLVDADYLVYRIGFAVKDDEPLEYALATVRSAVGNIWERFPNSPEHGKLFLTGKENFRDKVATLQVYKGNRDPANKPKFYTEIRQYMMDHQKATVVNFMEAEDRCGILQYSSKDRNTCIVGVDKDLLCIPGWHWNPVKGGGLVYVTLPEANEHFWKQVLTGDRVDNIRGIDGLGPKTADRIINPCGREWNRMQEAVINEYRKHYGNDAERVVDETAKLIWILRKEGQTYDGSSIWPEEKSDVPLSQS